MPQVLSCYLPAQVWRVLLQAIDPCCQQRRSFLDHLLLLGFFSSQAALPFGGSPLENSDLMPHRKTRNAVLRNLPTVNSVMRLRGPINTYSE